MTLNRAVVVKLTHEGIHSWPECPIEDVSFLRTSHRHIFHIEAAKVVHHNDRETEIIMLKRQIEAYLRQSLGRDLGRMSCEDIAERCIETFDLLYCKVLEDNENGAYLWRSAE